MLPTAENESLLLRTPISSEAEGGAIHPDDAKAGGHNLKLGWQVLALGGHIEPKLPTPTVSDQYTDNLKSSQQSDGSLHSVTLAQIVNRPDLLPTPNTMNHLPARTPEQKEANRGKGGYSNLRESVVNDLLPTVRAANGQDRNNTIYRRDDGKPQNIENALHALLPTPRAADRAPTSKEIAENDPKKRLEVTVMSQNWGKFAPAIHRWETTTGNPAPAPTIPDGKNGQHRLNPAFAEWMMGLPAGWVTDCDITRNEMLKACGNGVVPQQATLALTIMLEGKQS